MSVDYISFGYAAGVLAGGIIGYAKAGSVPSLGMGVLFGAILAFGAYQTSRNPNNYMVGLVASTLLAGVMGSRFYKTGKFMPAGLVGIMSTAMVIRYVSRSLLAKNQP